MFGFRITQSKILSFHKLSIYLGQSKEGIMVSSIAGGGTEAGARILAAVAEKKTGQPLVVVNKPGRELRSALPNCPGRSQMDTT